MPHIHTEPGQHDHTVSAFIIKMINNEPRLILHRHRKLGIYMQFGGHIELSETPWQAIIHELQEESGYTINQLNILQPAERLTRLSQAVAHPTPCNHNTHPIANQPGHFHTDINYAFVTDQDPAGEPNESESEDIRHFTKAELEQLPNTEINENVREIGLFILDVILSKWDRVPAGEL